MHNARTPRGAWWYPRRAFTLIELLMVIAIIALLIGILLPALSNARETARFTVCQSNISQFSRAVNLYAVDSKDLVWPMFEWAPVQFQLGTAPPRKGAGLLYQYVDDVYKINECPKNKRQGITGTVNTAIDPQFGRELGVGFDYTMVSRMQGLRLSSPVQVSYLKSPATYTAQSKPPLTMPAASLTRMNGTPIYLEESTLFNNTGITDGLWGNWDQLTRRHFKKCSIAFVEGHAGPFTPPGGTKEVAGTATPDARDLDCNDFYVLGARGWVRLEPTDTDNRLNFGERPYGWINSPR